MSSVCSVRGLCEVDLILQLPVDYVEKLRLQIPENMHKLLVDITLSFLDKGGYRGREAEQVAAIVEKAEHKEYGGMFEAVIESWHESYAEARAEGREEGRREGIALGQEKSREEIARNMKARGYKSEEIQAVTGFSGEEIEKL